LKEKLILDGSIPEYTVCSKKTNIQGFIEPERSI